MRLQPIENLSKTYSGDPHLGQTKLNGLLLLTIHGVLSGHQGGINGRPNIQSVPKKCTIRMLLVPQCTGSIAN